MAVLVPDDLAAWLYARLNVSAVTAAVSGGIFNGRPNETAASPYGVFTIERTGAQYTSAGEVPKFMARLAVMTDQAATTQAQGVQIAVANAVPVAPTGVTASIRSGAGTVIQCEPRDGSAPVEFPMRAKSDVVACRFAWEIMAQGY